MDPNQPDENDPIQDWADQFSAALSGDLREVADEAQQEVPQSLREDAANEGDP